MLSIDTSTLAVPERAGPPGLRTRDLTSDAVDGRISPYLVVSLFDMWGPGFPPHPHAGSSVATYIFPESDIGFWTQDAIGNVEQIGPGSFHLTVAGSGVMHEETVTRSGRHARGFQIWIDHAPGDRQVAPSGLHLAAEEVPVITADGSVRRVLLGTTDGVASPLLAPTAAQLVDVEMSPGATLEHRLSKRQRGFVWVRSGGVAIAGQAVPAGAVHFLKAGTALITAASEGARLTVFAGEPMADGHVSAGPFVASSAVEAREFRARFAAGQMGRLRAFDQAALDRAFDTEQR
jgi:hypothetical protein